jgi:hypothetical protein
VDLWLQADLLGLLQQLGVMPPVDLAQAVTMAQVLRAGALLAGEPAPRAPPPGRGVVRDLSRRSRASTSVSHLRATRHENARRRDRP